MNALTLIAAKLLLGLTLGLGLALSHATCEEDQPCWDCHSMGNHLCGGER